MSANQPASIGYVMSWDSGLPVEIPKNRDENLDSCMCVRRRNMMTHRPESVALAMAQIPTPGSVEDLLASAGLGEDDVHIGAW